MGAMNKIPSPKEKAVYQAVLELFEEGADLISFTVAEITGKAGIGKGTAYEYFSDKEDMIAKALFYNAGQICLRIYERLKKEKSLYDKLNFILIKMEKQVTETSCIIRMIHMMADNSIVSRRLQALEKESEKEMPAVELLRRLLLDELGETELSSEKMSYLIMSILSQILCYGMLLRDEKYMPEDSREKMREMICRGICREVEEMKQQKEER